MDNELKEELINDYKRVLERGDEYIDQSKNIKRLTAVQLKLREIVELLFKDSTTWEEIDVEMELEKSIRLLDKAKKRLRKKNYELL